VAFEMMRMNKTKREKTFFIQLSIGFEMSVESRKDLPHRNIGT